MAAKKRSRGKEPKTTVMHFSMPAALDHAIRDDARIRFETLSQWFRNVAVRTLRQRGALPK